MTRGSHVAGGEEVDLCSTTEERGADIRRSVVHEKAEFYLEEGTKKVRSTDRSVPSSETKEEIPVGNKKTPQQSDSHKKTSPRLPVSLEPDVARLFYISIAEFDK